MTQIISEIKTKVKSLETLHTKKKCKEKQHKNASAKKECLRKSKETHFDTLIDLMIRRCHE